MIQKVLNAKFIIYKENFLFVISKKPCFYLSEKLDIKHLCGRRYFNLHKEDKNATRRRDQSRAKNEIQFLFDL